MKKKKQNTDIEHLREVCPLPLLLNKQGMGKFAKSSCHSPFRADQKPSWGIFQGDGGKWFFKDHATDEFGDEIDFLAKHHKLDPKKDFRKLLKLWDKIARSKSNGGEIHLGELAATTEPSKPNFSGFGYGTDQELQMLSELRGISVPALGYAQDSSHLVFGLWGNRVVYAVRDCTLRVMEKRCLDGEPFFTLDCKPGTKVLSEGGGVGSRCLGHTSLDDKPFVALVEGGTDFLALHDFILRENRAQDVAPVCMLGAGNEIPPDALENLQGKHVRIFPDVDEAGMNAAKRWNQQLRDIATVDWFDLSKFGTKEQPVGDLNDYLRFCNSQSINERILP